MIDRTKKYPRFVGLLLSDETYAKIEEYAKNNYDLHTKNIMGRDLKQPKKMVSTAIRDILNKFLEKT